MYVPVRKLKAVLCAALTSLTSCAAAEAFELREPKVLPKPRAVAPARYSSDILLVMPNANCDKDEFGEVMQDVHGTVLGSLGEGALRCYVIKTEKGKFEETEKKLAKDKEHISVVSRNYEVAKTATVPNDFGSAMGAYSMMRCEKAWDYATGSGVTIAVLDTGCAAVNQDLSGKLYKGYDAHTAAQKALGAAGAIFGPIPGVTEVAGAIAGAVGDSANNDNQGHGTLVATTAAGNWNNKDTKVKKRCGVAPNARVYPIRIADSTFNGKAIATDLDIIAAMIHVMSTGIRIVNISYSIPYAGFANPALHPALHRYFMSFYTQRSGLIFMSAGNIPVCETIPKVPYIVVVNGIDANGELADYGGIEGSAWGTFVWFTGPSVDVACSDKNGDPTSASGTSLSTPMVAGVAALIMDKMPMAPNVEILRIMIQSCRRLKGYGIHPLYGFGMPDAAYAAGLAAGKSKSEIDRPPAAVPGNSPVGAGAVAGGSRPPVARGGGMVAPRRP